MVITGWQRRGLDGTELAALIRTSQAVPYAYVLVLAGAADDGEMVRLIRCAARRWRHPARR